MKPAPFEYVVAHSVEEAVSWLGDDDVRVLAEPVLRHRVLVNFRAEAEGMTADSIVARLLAEVPGPRSPLD